MRRRDALVVGGAMAVAIAIPPILRRLPAKFEFEPLPGLDGFRRISGGATSGGPNPFFGLDAREPDQTSVAENEPVSPCLALFGRSGWSPERLPVAIFSDFNCPYCRDLEARLVALRDAGMPLRLIWHELPLLGPSSMRSARAVIAARFLGAETRARAYLSSRTLRPGPVGLLKMADAIDLPAEMLVHEVNSARVSETIGQSIHLGQRLGIPGTPGTVFGRTLVIGAIKDADIRRLVEIEQSEPQAICT